MHRLHSAIPVDFQEEEKKTEEIEQIFYSFILLDRNLSSLYYVSMVCPELSYIYIAQDHSGNFQNDEHNY